MNELIEGVFGNAGFLGVNKISEESSAWYKQLDQAKEYNRYNDYIESIKLSKMFWD